MKENRRRGHRFGAGDCGARLLGVGAGSGLGEPQRGIKGNKSPEPAAPSGQGLKRGYIGSSVREENWGGNTRIWSVLTGWEIEKEVSGFES